MFITGNPADVAGPYVAACGEIEALIAKDGKGVYGKYPTLAGILERIKPVMTRHKLTILQEPVTTEDGVGVATAILHESGARIQFDPLIIPIADRKPHTVGSALSYAKRYALTAVLGLAGDDDDDGQGAQDSYKQKPKAAAATTNGTSHHSLPRGAEAQGDDTLWDTPAAHTKKPDTATPAQVKRANALGVKFYGTEVWHQKLPGIVAGASTGDAKTLEALKDVEIDRVISGLDKRIAERAAQTRGEQSESMQAAAN